MFVFSCVYIREDLPKPAESTQGVKHEQQAEGRGLPRSLTTFLFPEGDLTKRPASYLFHKMLSSLRQIMLPKLT